jgi:fructose-1,6-bisphosphatase/inositol monophosphatase family enzyme
VPLAGRVGKDEAHTHPDGSSFTDVELAMEQTLKAEATKLYPKALITGEEEISEDPQGFLNEAKNHLVIIFDPIDGTGAFIRGEGAYSHMAVLIHKGETEAGIIYTPGHGIADARGILTPQKDIMILAQRGQGCYLSGQPAQITARAQSLSDKARVAFACYHQDAGEAAFLEQGVPGAQRRKNPGSDYTGLLQNSVDATFYSEGFMPETGLGKCPPWDHAAGVLAVREAGGYVALPYGPVGQGGLRYDPLTCHDRLLVAANRSLFDHIHAHVAQRRPHLVEPRNGKGGPA